MNGPLIGRMKMALKRAALGVVREVVSENGDPVLFLFAGNDDRMFVSSAFDGTDVIQLVKVGPDHDFSGPICAVEVAYTRDISCAVSWMRRTLESLPRDQHMKNLDDGELLALLRKLTDGRFKHASRN